MAINFRTATVLLIAATFLVGCTGSLQEVDILKQVNERLPENKIGCSLSAEYKGVGEGDTDTAYATVALRRKKGDASKPSRDIELMFSHQRNGGWLITDDSSIELISTAKVMCQKLGSG